MYGETWRYSEGNVGTRRGYGDTGKYGGGHGESTGGNRGCSEATEQNLGQPRTMVGGPRGLSLSSEEKWRGSRGSGEEFRLSC